MTIAIVSHTLYTHMVYPQIPFSAKDTLTPLYLLAIFVLVILNTEGVFVKRIATFTESTVAAGVLFAVGDLLWLLARVVSVEEQVVAETLITRVGDGLRVYRAIGYSVVLVAVVGEQVVTIVASEAQISRRVLGTMSDLAQ